MASKKRKLPAELEGVAFTEDVSAIEEKVGRCYSQDRYQDFQTAVKTIVIDTLGGDDGRTKVKAHATEATKDYLRDASWEKAKFWIPTAIAVISIAWNVYQAYHSH
jgi:hypothetical protein